jgi:tetratricopeptide (TPR) repeat protein
MKIRIILLGICLIIAWNSHITMGADIQFYFDRGNDYYNEGNFDKAIADYTKVISMSPNQADVYFNRGHAYYKKEKYEEAIKDYTKGIELRPDDAEIYYHRGLAYFKRG